MNRPLIRTEGLCRFFKLGEQEIRAVDHVSFSLFPGDFVAIMGPSGSGKTTLLNLIGLLDYPSQGKLFFEGKEVSALKESQRERLRLTRLGFIFQTFNLIPVLTALENVALPLLALKVPAGQRKKRAIELLSRLGLGEHLNHYPSQLSAGEQQRVAIARALINRPSLLLADEPTGNLDLKSKEEIATLFQEINKQDGVTILLVTHDHMVASKAKKRYKIIDGRLIDELS